MLLPRALLPQSCRTYSLIARRSLQNTSKRPRGHACSLVRAQRRTRRGVEAFIEPRTTVTETTVLLVAHDGEWTRRRIDGPDVARRLSKELAIPVYDAQVTGYPQRMRDWTAKQTANRLA